MPKTNTNRISRLAIAGVALAMAVQLCTTQRAWASDYGEWKTISAHDGVDFRVRCGDAVNGQYMWWVQFRNHYNQPVSFSYKITPVGERPRGFADRVTIRPGGLADDNWNMVAVGPSGEVEVWTEEWKIGPDAY